MKAFGNTIISVKIAPLSPVRKTSERLGRFGGTFVISPLLTWVTQYLGKLRRIS